MHDFEKKSSKWTFSTIYMHHVNISGQRSANCVSKALQNPNQKYIYFWNIGMIIFFFCKSTCERKHCTSQNGLNSIWSGGVKRSITEVQHPDAGGIGGESPDQMHLHTNTLRDRDALITVHILTADTQKNARQLTYSRCLLHLSRICHRKRNGCWSRGQSGRSNACVWPVKKHQRKHLMLWKKSFKA